MIVNEAFDTNGLVTLPTPSKWMSWTSNIYISAKNKDKDTKPSGYDPWGPPRSSMVSRMTLSSKSHVRNPPTSSKCPPSRPHLPDRLPIEISSQNFQGIFLGVKKTWFMKSGMTLSFMFPIRNSQCPPSTMVLDASLPYTLLIEISTRSF